MDTDFTELMSKNTTEELIKITTVDRDGYQPLAIKTAEEELKKRNVSETKVEEETIKLLTKKFEEYSLESFKVNSVTRFLHCLVDMVAIFILFNLLAFMLRNLITTDEFNFVIIFYNSIWLISFISYYLFMETKFQKTLGKFLSKTKVVNKDGTKTNFGDIMRRTLCRLIPFDCISYLITKNGLHDHLTETIVIKDVGAY